MTHTKPSLGSTVLNEVLAAMNRQGDFSITVLTDLDGLPIAWAAGRGQNPEMQAAAVAMVHKTTAQMRDRLGMAPIAEVTLQDTDGRRLICRPFSANGHNLILAVLAPNKNQSYRRLTNQAVTAIRRQWEL
jgi:predicted regulator of Ras-like GTPase activity (Roadblock/LC7/MglB family)